MFGCARPAAAGDGTTGSSFGRASPEPGRANRAGAGASSTKGSSSSSSGSASADTAAGGSERSAAALATSPAASCRASRGAARNKSDRPTAGDNFLSVYLSESPLVIPPKVITSVVSCSL